MSLTNDLVTAHQAADLLGVSRARIGALCRQGRFPGAALIGPLWMIPKADVENFKRLPRGPKIRSE